VNTASTARTAAAPAANESRSRRLGDAVAAGNL